MFVSLLAVTLGSVGDSQQPVGTFGGFVTVTGTRLDSEEPEIVRLATTGLGGSVVLSHELSKDRAEPRADQVSDQIEDPRLASLVGTVPVAEVLGGEPTIEALWVAMGPILGELSAFNSEIGAAKEAKGFERTIGAV